MSLWKRIACSPEVEQRMKQYYAEKGLADIRIYLAQWIEERIMSERLSNPTSEVYERVAHIFYDELQQKLLALSSDEALQFKLPEICSLITQIPALDLYSHVRNGLQKELQLLEHIPQMAQMAYFPTAAGLSGHNGMVGTYGALAVAGPMEGKLSDTGVNLQNLRAKVDVIGQNIQILQVRYEPLRGYFSGLSQQDAIQAERQLTEQLNSLLTAKSTLELEFARVVSDYDRLQEIVINELKTWQRNQALAGNGAPFNESLDEIQFCIETLVEIVCKILQDLATLIRLELRDNAKLNLLHSRMSDAQKLLVFSAFIVEKQPPQVMKTNTRFASAVRWLIGPQLGISVNCPTVECVILSEAQAQRHSTQRTMADMTNNSPPHSGEIMNNATTMEYQQQSRSFSASFRNMQLKKIKRAEKKGTESVMDEKFALLFYTESIVNQCRIYVWTLSLPVVVIVHGNQEPQSWATITWDNAFSEIIREPFQVPDKVSWSQLSCALNTKFASVTQRGLTDDNLIFLYEKLFRNDGMGGDHKDYITWPQFCKEPLPDRPFTFWEWFFAIMKLTKDHLLQLWKAGLIVGFIDKRKTTDDILKLNSTGVFLIRFSDSELGGITVAVVDDQFQVINLSPWTARDLNIRGLAERVNDIQSLSYVYPLNMPKHEAFKTFFAQTTEEQLSRNGYVPNGIRTHVPALNGNTGATPPQNQMQSPNPHTDIQMTNAFADVEWYLPGAEPEPARAIEDMNWVGF